MLEGAPAGALAHFLFAAMDQLQQQSAPPQEYSPKPILRIVLSILAMLLALTQVDAHGLLENLSLIPLWAFALAFILHVAIVLVLAVRWSLTIRAYEARISGGDAIGMTFLGSLLNLTLPGAVAGDMARGWLGYRSGLSLPIAMGSQFLDRIVGLIGLGLLLSGMAMLPQATHLPLPLRLALLSILPIALLALLGGSRLASLFAGWPRIAHLAAQLGRGFQLMTGRAAVLVPTLILAVTGHLISVLIATMVAQSAGYPLTWLQGLQLFPPVILVAMIPISIGGWGFRELSVIALFAQAGISSDSALVVSVVFGLAQTAAAVAGTALWYGIGKLRPAAAMATARRERPALTAAGRQQGNNTAWAIASLALCAGLLVYFHNRFWWPPDEGVYGYVAQRILAGDILNGNLQDLHAGYVGFLNAAALFLFGQDLVSLRYPLVAATLLQCSLAFLLLAPRSRVLAALAAVMVGATSFIQFLNPSANWYALTMAFVVAAVLTLCRRGSFKRDALVGALLATCFLLRQLSGVFLAIGALTWLLMESSPTATGRSRIARALLAVMGLGLIYYLYRKGSFDSFLMFGIWPLALIGIASVRTRLADGAALRLLARMAAGGALAALPLLLYHLWHGSLYTWLQDTILAAVHLTQLDFFEQQRYWHLAVQAIANLVTVPTAGSVVSSLFWLALLTAPAALGLRTLWLAASHDGPQSWHPLPIIATMFAMVSTHYEITIYLVFSSSLTLTALLLLGGSGRSARMILWPAAVALSLVGVALHAGQPISRSIAGTIAGVRVPLDAPSALPGASLVIERLDQETYAKLLAFIDRNVAPGAPILALPVDPEIYFLSRRPAIYRFNSTAIGIRNDDELRTALQRFDQASPPIVIHNAEDKYNNWASEALMAHVKSRYSLEERIGPFDIYLPN